MKKKRPLITTKLVLSGGEPFIFRISLNFKKGSIKLHLIVNDDQDGLHTHPWDFTSFILFGGYFEETSNSCQNYNMFSINRKKYNEQHCIKLKRFLSFKIPTLTIGRYSKKFALCSHCQPYGYCLNSIYD